MIELVCIDVDGTLVGSGNYVLPVVWEAVARAHERGVRLALASGRPAFGITRDYATRLAPDGWHLFQNGASIVNVGNDASSSSPLSADAVAALVAQARAQQRILELYSDTDYVVEGTGPWPREHAELLGIPYDANRRFEALRGAPVRAQWLVPHGELERVSAEAVAGTELVPSVSPVMPETSFVVMTAFGVNKGSGVRTIASRYNIPLSNVMFVGDAANDLSALRIVGHPVAMGNAEPEIHAVARYGVGHVDAGGLTEALDIAVAASR